MINSVFQIVKELHAAERGQRGVIKLHNAKTPVMRHVHQPGFPENPREVRDFAAPPGLNRGLPHILPFQTIGRAIIKMGLY